MPRGHTAKVNRAHNKAMKQGNSCKGASGTTSHQMKGKKYKKGDAKTQGDGCIKVVIYNGSQYNLQYKFIDDRFKIISMITNSDTCSTNHTDVRRNMDKNSCQELQQQVVRENLNALTDFALKYDQITIPNYIKLVKEKYIKCDDVLLKKKLTNIVNSN